MFWVPGPLLQKNDKTIQNPLIILNTKVIGFIANSYTLSQSFKPYLNFAYTCSWSVSVQCSLRSLCVCSSFLVIPIIQMFQQISRIINLNKSNIIISSFDENCIPCNCWPGEKPWPGFFWVKMPSCRLKRRITTETILPNQTAPQSTAASAGTIST